MNTMFKDREKARGRRSELRSVERDKTGGSLFWKYTAGAIFTIGVVIAIRILIVTPDSGWGWTFLSVATIVVGATGMLFSYIGAWRAHMAERKTEDLLSKLLETQDIIKSSTSYYKEVFEIHALSPFTDHQKDGTELERVHLLISTPAYGYHVLGESAHAEFHNALDVSKGTKQIIFFSPDSHYFHVANTVLWSPLVEYLRNEPAEGNGRKPGRENQDETDGKRVIVNPTGLVGCIEKTMDMLENKIKSETKDMWQIWVSSGTAFRMSAFKYSGRPNRLVFLILTDVVSLTSNLLEFRGRAIGIPSVMHSHVVGEIGNEQAFFEQLKQCPFSLRSGEDARLDGDEVNYLKYDYILLRTEQEAFSLACFDIECERLIYRAYNTILGSYRPATDLQRATRHMLLGVAEYFATIFDRRGRIGTDYFPDDDKQYCRLKNARATADMLTQDINVDLDQLLNVALSGLHDDDKIEESINNHMISVQENYPARVDLSKLTALVYYFMSSGFERSLFAKMRAEGLPATQDSSVESEESSDDRESSSELLKQEVESHAESSSEGTPNGESESDNGKKQ